MCDHHTFGPTQRRYSARCSNTNCLSCDVSPNLWTHAETVFGKMFHEAAAVARGELAGMVATKLPMGFAPAENVVYTAAPYAPKPRL